MYNNYNRSPGTSKMSSSSILKSLEGSRESRQARGTERASESLRNLQRAQEKGLGRVVVG